MEEEIKNKEMDSGEQGDKKNDVANTTQEIERLNKKITELEFMAVELEFMAEDYLSGWKRTKADFINYKKDEEKHAANVLKFIKINFLKKLLPILDSLEEAKKQKNLEMEALSSQVAQIFKSEGLEEIEALGKMFDPNFHESVGAVESSGEENLVAEELRKGYMVEGEVIRPSIVKITANNLKNGN